MNVKNTNKIEKWENIKEFLGDKTLISIVIGSFIIRLIFIFEINGTPFLTHLLSDSKIYFDWASKILTTHDWIGKDAFFMAPIYPYILAFVFLLVGKSVLVIQILQAIVGSVTVLNTYFIGKNFHSKVVGYIAAIISGSYLLYIFYCGMILSETFQTFVISLLLVYLSKDIKKGNNHNWLIIGILLGIAALFRANILFFPIILVFWLLSDFLTKKKNIILSVKQFSFLILGTLLAIAPVTIRNYFISDEFVLLTTNGGINFYIGNNQNSIGVFVTPTDFDFANDLAGKQFAEKQSGAKLSYSEASSFWYDKAMKDIKKNPGGTIALYFKKLFLFFGEAENPQSTIMNPEYFAENYSRLLQIPWFGFSFIAFFFVFGLFFSIKNRINKPLLSTFLISFIFGTLLFFVNGRFRLAITPLIIVYSSYGIFEIFNRIKDAKFRDLSIPSIIVIVFVIFYYFIINKPVFSQYDAFLHLGDVAYEEGKFEQAIENYNRSLFYRDFHLTYVNLGNAYARKEDFKSAVAAYNRALSRKPNDLLAHFNLASALTQMGKLDDGLKEFQKVLEMDPGYVNAYRNIGIIYYVSDQYNDALKYFNKFLAMSNDEEINNMVRQDIENINRKLLSLQNQK